MTAPKVEPARQAPPTGQAVGKATGKKGGGKGWLWFLLLILLAGLGTAGWFYWPKLLPSLQKLPLVGRLLPSGTAGQTPLLTEGPPLTEGPSATDPAGQQPQAETPAPTQAELEARAAELDKLAKSLADERLQLDQQKAAMAGAQRLAAIYREMKPASAATILSRLSDDDVVPILLALPNDQVAQILAALDQARAAQLTRRIRTLVTP